MNRIMNSRSEGLMALLYILKCRYDMITMKTTVAHMINARGAPVQMQLYKIVIILT